MSMKKLTKKVRPAKSKLEGIPNTSGIYILHRGTKSRYVGSAEAGNLQQRIKQQLKQKRGITSFHEQHKGGKGAGEEVSRPSKSRATKNLKSASTTYPEGCFFVYFSRYSPTLISSWPLAHIKRL